MQSMGQAWWLYKVTVLSYRARKQVSNEISKRGTAERRTGLPWRLGIRLTSGMRQYDIELTYMS